MSALVLLLFGCALTAGIFGAIDGAWWWTAFCFVVAWLALNALVFWRGAT